MSNPWAELDIAPVDDERAVRRAYAARLKSIDVERDPAAFQALRMAFEHATWLCRQAHEAAQVVDEAEPSAVDPLPVDDGRSTPPDATAPVDASPPDWVGMIVELQELINGDQSREAIYDRVTALTERLIATPEMTSIDHAIQIERWVAETIITGLPRTNAMLLPAINAFGWWKMADNWDCPPIIQHILQRYRDASILYELCNDASGRPGRLWRMLSDPDTKPSARDSSAMQAFLALIDQRTATLLDDCDPKALAAWTDCIERWNNRPLARFDRWVREATRKVRLLTVRLRLHWIGYALMGMILIVVVIGIASVSPALAIAVGISAATGFGSSGYRSRP